MTRQQALDLAVEIGADKRVAFVRAFDTAVEVCADPSRPEELTAIFEDLKPIPKRVRIVADSIRPWAAWIE